MGILATRGSSQILRTFLPEQTVDLKGRIYRVDDWSAPVPINVDTSLIQRHLLREIGPWTAHGTDGGLGADLRKGVPVEVVELDDQRGVDVRPYPEIWL